MASGFRGKPGEGIIPSENIKKSLLWIVLGIIAFILLIVLASYMKQRRTENPSGSAFELKVPAPQVQMSRGTTTITQGDWKGVSSLDSSKRIMGKMLTSDTWWQVRLDQDDTKIFDCYPANWKNGAHLELPDFNMMEWRIKPGQSIASATVAWEIVDRK